MPYLGVEDGGDQAEVPWLDAVAEGGRGGIGRRVGAVIAAGCWSHTRTIVQDEILSGHQVLVALSPS